ncbi:hypothetical protein [Desulfurobacterium sp.]
MRKCLMFLPLIIFTSSCFLVPYNEEFTCPMMGKGVCESVPDVYKDYKSGRFKGEENATVRTYYPEACRQVVRCRKSFGNNTVCEKVIICEPDTVKAHIDYRAEAVKDNTPEVQR